VLTTYRHVYTLIPRQAEDYWPIIKQDIANPDISSHLLAGRSDGSAFSACIGRESVDSRDPEQREASAYLNRLPVPPETRRNINKDALLTYASETAYLAACWLWFKLSIKVGFMVD